MPCASLNPLWELQELFEVGGLDYGNGVPKKFRAAAFKRSLRT